MVSDAQVDRQIEALLESQMKIIPITDRAAQVDDEVVLNYAGEINGEYFEGGTAENQTLVIGSGMFIPGFEEQLIGHLPGEDVDVRVTFPANYHAKSLAGRAAVFHCKLKEIRLKEKYAPDDIFAREVGNCKSFEDMRISIHTALQLYADSQAEMELKYDLLDQICASAQFDISKDQLDRALDLEMKSLENHLARQGLTLEAYLNFLNSTKEKLLEDQLPIARRNIERQLAISEIARLEGIEADEEAVAEKLRDICLENKTTISKLQPHMDAAFQAAVEQSVITDKVLDFVLSHAEIETVTKKE